QLEIPPRTGRRVEHRARLGLRPGRRGNSGQRSRRDPGLQQLASVDFHGASPSAIQLFSRAWLEARSSSTTLDSSIDSVGSMYQSIAPATFHSGQSAASSTYDVGNISTPQAVIACLSKSMRIG